MPAGHDSCLSLGGLHPWHGTDHAKHLLAPGLIQRWGGSVNGGVLIHNELSGLKSEPQYSFPISSSAPWTGLLPGSLAQEAVVGQGGGLERGV